MAYSCSWSDRDIAHAPRRRKWSTSSPSQEWSYPHDGPRTFPHHPDLGLQPEVEQWSLVSPNQHGTAPKMARTEPDITATVTATATAHSHSTQSQQTVTAHSHSHSTQSQHTVTAHNHSTQSQHTVRVRVRTVTVTVRTVTAYSQNSHSHSHSHNSHSIQSEKSQSTYTALSGRRRRAGRTARMRGPDDGHGFESWWWVSHVGGWVGYLSNKPRRHTVWTCIGYTVGSQAPTRSPPDHPITRSPRAHRRLPSMPHHSRTARLGAMVCIPSDDSCMVQSGDRQMSRMAMVRV